MADNFKKRMSDINTKTNEAENAVNGLEKSLFKVGKTLGNVSNQVSELSRHITINKKDIETTTRVMQYFDKSLKEVYKIKTKSTSINGSTILPETITKVDVKPIKEYENDQDKVNKKTSRFGILLNQIKRIAVYRAIRRGLQIITQTFTQSISRLAQFDEKVNENVSTITSAFKNLQNSVAVAFYPVLNSLAPVIDSLAVSFGNFANQLSLATAKLTGQSKYLQVNTKYFKDYAKSIKNTNSQLLSFDKFEVLQSKQSDNVEDMFSESVIDGSEQVNENVMNFAKTLQRLPDILHSIYNTANKLYKEIVEPILPYLFEVSKWIVDAISWLVQGADKLGILRGAIYGLMTLGLIAKISSLVKGLSSISVVLGAIGIALSAINITAIIDKWKQWNETSKGVAAGLLAITAVLTAVAVAIYAASQQWAKAIAIGGIILASGTSVSLGLGNLISGFEQGGIPDKSELFYMNEYGKPEAMMQASGQTNVINQEQLRFITKEGFKAAIYETGLLDVMQERIVLDGRNIDNNSVARGLFNALKVESTRRGGNQL